MSQLFDYFVVVGLVPLPPSPLDDDEDAVTFMPQVIDRYPLQEATGRCGYECPPTLPFFAIPEGAIRTDAEGQIFKSFKRKTQDRFFTFVLTDGAGASYYGGCIQRFFPSVEGKSALPRSICVLSRVPAFEAFRDVLVRLHVLTGGVAQLNVASKHFLQSLFPRSRTRTMSSAISQSLAFERGVRIAVPQAPIGGSSSSIKEDTIVGDVVDSWMRGMSTKFRGNGSKSVSLKKEDAMMQQLMKQVNEKPQKRESIQGDAFVDVLVPEVINNGKVTVIAPDGRKLQVVVPAGTTPGTTLRIPVPPMTPPLPPQSEIKPPSALSLPSSETTGVKVGPASPVRRSLLMDMMGRRSEPSTTNHSVNQSMDDQKGAKWVHSLLRCVFPKGVVGMDIAECELGEVPLQPHKPEFPKTSTASVLQLIRLEDEMRTKKNKPNTEPDDEQQNSLKEVVEDDRVVVAYITEVASGCAAALMGFEVGDIIIAVSDVLIKGAKPAQQTLKCIDTSEALSMTVLKRSLNPRAKSAIPALETPLENIISYMVDFTPIPPRGADLEARIMGGSLSRMDLAWSYGEVSPLPFIEPSCLAELAQSMESKDVVTLLEALLQEQRVCILSHDVTQLTPVCEALRNLIFPLKWQHAYIPLLPKELLGYLEAPIPFMVGLDEGYFDEDPMVADAVDASAAVTVRLNLKTSSSDGLWSTSVHVPDFIGFVSMCSYQRQELIRRLDDAFIPYRNSKATTLHSTSSNAASSGPSSNQAGPTSSYWRMLGGNISASRHQHPLSLAAGLAPEGKDEKIRKDCWRQCCDLSQQACFQTVAEVLNGYDKFLTLEEVKVENDTKEGGEERRDLIPSFDREGFMAHHRHQLFRQESRVQTDSDQESNGEHNTSIQVAPVSAKFVENMIQTQLFEAFIEESFMFPEFVYFKECSAGGVFPNQSLGQLLRPSVTTLPVPIWSSSVASFFSYGTFPRLDGAKLRNPPQALQPPELTTPPSPPPLAKEDGKCSSSPSSTKQNESVTSPKFMATAEMMNTSRNSSATKSDIDPLTSPKNLHSRGYRGSGEWNQTMDAKLLFGRTVAQEENSDISKSYSESDESEEDIEPDYYEHDFKVFTREESAEPSEATTMATSSSCTPTNHHEVDNEKKVETESTSPEKSNTTGSWGRGLVTSLSLKSASHAAAAAASASMSAVSIAGATVSGVSSKSPKSSEYDPEKAQNDETDPLGQISVRPMLRSASAPLPPPRPLVTRWDPTQPPQQTPQIQPILEITGEKEVEKEEGEPRRPSRTAATRSHSLWDKSALAYDAKSKYFSGPTSSHRPNVVSNKKASSIRRSSLQSLLSTNPPRQNRPPEETPQHVRDFYKGMHGQPRDRGGRGGGGGINVSAEEYDPDALPISKPLSVLEALQQQNDEKYS